MKFKAAIIGDRFMRSEIFVQAIGMACGERVECRGTDLPWPDEPVVHGYAKKGLDGLKEYLGTPESVIEFARGSDMLVTHLAPLNESVFAALPELKMVVVSRGGPVNVDMAAAARHGVIVANTPGRNTTAVAQFTVGAIIAETRNITRGHVYLRQGEYRNDLYRFDTVGKELQDLKFGVIGYGVIGKKFVDYMIAFGTEIFVFDPFAELLPAHRVADVKQLELNELLEISDVVTLLCRVTADNVGMIGEDEFAAMKQGATFVNTARGPLVDYDALYAALTSGKLKGAVLDTFAVEPVPPSLPLLKLPNVTLTPHIAGASTTTAENSARLAAEEIRRWVSGEPPLSAC
ncbi:MAG: oxidoreductase [Albidovulum sp.]|nr:oxidoreductase [Albidovulum sp.]